MKNRNFVLGVVGVLALVTGLSVSSAHGATNSQGVNYEDMTMCELDADIATNVMRLRQSNTPSSLVESVFQTESSLAIVEMAYSRPVVEGKVAKRQSVEAFSKHVKTICESVKADEAKKNWKKVDGVAL